MSISPFFLLVVVIGVMAAELPSVCHLRAIAEGERARLEAERIRKDTADAAWLNRTLIEGGIESLSYIMFQRMLIGAEERARQGECATTQYDIPDNWAQHMNPGMVTEFRAALESIVTALGFVLHLDYKAIMTVGTDGPVRSHISMHNVAHYGVGWCK
jgi:hypothetical protein